MTEAVLQRAVIEEARRRGWKVAHFLPATRGGRYFTPVSGDGVGFPDLVLTRERVMFVELKQDGKYPSPLQKAWHLALAQAGAEVHVWKPRDWREGVVSAALA